MPQPRQIGTLCRSLLPHVRGDLGADERFKVLVARGAGWRYGVHPELLGPVAGSGAAPRSSTTVSELSAALRSIDLALADGRRVAGRRTPEATDALRGMLRKLQSTPELRSVVDANFFAWADVAAGPAQPDVVSLTRLRAVRKRLETFASRHNIPEDVGSAVGSSIWLRDGLRIDVKRLLATGQSSVVWMVDATPGTFRSGGDARAHPARSWVATPGAAPVKAALGVQRFDPRDTRRSESAAMEVMVYVALSCATDAGGAHAASVPEVLRVFNKGGLLFTLTEAWDGTLDSAISRAFPPQGILGPDRARALARAHEGLAACVDAISHVARALRNWNLARLPDGSRGRFMHRDLHAGNVMVRARGHSRYAIIDFGMAKTNLLNATDGAPPVALGPFYTGKYVVRPENKLPRNAPPDVVRVLKPLIDAHYRQTDRFSAEWLGKATFPLRSHDIAMLLMSIHANVGRLHAIIAEQHPDPYARGFAKYVYNYIDLYCQRYVEEAVGRWYAGSGADRRRAVVDAYKRLGMQLFRYELYDRPAFPGRVGGRPDRLDVMFGYDKVDEAMIDMRNLLDERSERLLEFEADSDAFPAWMLSKFDPRAPWNR